MDPLTHTATGLFLSRAGLHRLTPRATPILLLAANAPDVDIVTTAGGSLNYLHYHRHLTHSLLAMPVLAIACVALVRGTTRKPVRWLGAFLAALVAVGSHLALDWTNVYGIRLLLPFSGAWLRLDLTQVVDLWIWGVFLACLAGPFLARLVTAEITSGKPGGPRHGRGFAWLALLFLLLYNGGREVLHARAVATLNARLYGGQEPTRVAAFPDLNPFLWRGLVETPEFYRMQAVDLAGIADSTPPATYPKLPANAAMQAARDTPVFRTFLGFSQFPLWEEGPTEEPEGGKQVSVLDLRFGTPQEPAFTASAILDRRGAVVETKFQFGAARPR
jgi:inner membrane protein